MSIDLFYTNCKLQIHTVKLTYILSLVVLLRHLPKLYSPDFTKDTTCRTVERAFSMIKWTFKVTRTVQGPPVDLWRYRLGPIESMTRDHGQATTRVTFLVTEHHRSPLTASDMLLDDRSTRVCEQLAYGCYSKARRPGVVFVVNAKKELESC